MLQRGRRIVSVAIFTFVTAVPAAAAEFSVPAYHADPFITCIDGGPQAPERIVIDEPTIYPMAAHQPLQVVGWLPILYRAPKGSGGAQHFGPYVLDSPFDTSQIHWYIAGPAGRYQGAPEQVYFERLPGARFKVAILFIWMDLQGAMVGWDLQVAEQHLYTAEIFPFPLPYCDFAQFDVIPI